MKALILAAGLGTRLLPFTRLVPKPLFTLNERPLLDLAITRLLQAGCRSIMVNTHHGHEQIEAFLKAQSYPLPVHYRYEPELLGTGGAIRNVADFWDHGPLMVVNADIISDIDLAQVYHDHQHHPYAVTMVMQDHPDFNTVSVDSQGFVSGFGPDPQSADRSGRLAFTGIHVVNRTVLDFLPAKGPAHIIDAYTRMLSAGHKIKVWQAQNHYWQDIGTPDRYRSAVLEHMAPIAFEKAFGQNALRPPIVSMALQGDGSDRRWFRLRSGSSSLVMVDHGIRRPEQLPQEVDAFVAIGHHLDAKGIAVPRIHLFDRLAGLVFLEDLGDRHLQQAALAQSPHRQKQLYYRVIDQWLHMAIAGYQGFDPSWTYQSQRYDREVILDKECRYFVDAFLQGYLKWNLSYDDLAAEFESLADSALSSSTVGFLHRDFQSRNIMLKNNAPCFIDFQGGRIGPLQYDLASLLIDPYVALPLDLQEVLLGYAATAVARRMGVQVDLFLRGYDCCTLTRSLQMLGAFAFLSQVKGKPQFETYIPQAVRTLRQRMVSRTVPSLPRLAEIVDAVARHIGV